MLVEVFPQPGLINNGAALLPLSSQLPLLSRINHRRTRTMIASSTSSSEVTMPSTTEVVIEYNKDSKHHIVTIPSFLPTDNNDYSDKYPSLLHRIHILPLLTTDETTNLLEFAQTHATENQSWDKQDTTRHVSYPTVDFAIDESFEISQYLGGIHFEQRIFGALSDAYDVDVEDMSFLDLFCASYEVKDDSNDDDTTTSIERNTMDRLDYHRDGSLLSFTILLSSPDEFEGGGTIFDALGNVTVLENNTTRSILQPPGVIQPPNAGYATLHSGKLLHGGHVVTKGQRIVLVGFVDVHSRNMKPGALGKATKEWGRNDVRNFWNQRRLSLKQQQEQQQNVEEENIQPVWKLKNWSTKDARSYFGKDSIIPSFLLENIQRRSNLDKIRNRRLRTEDKLLREILLPREERGEKVDEEDEGEWMEVDADSLDGLMLGWDEDN